jgi:hypothetical protein
MVMATMLVILYWTALEDALGISESAYIVATACMFAGLVCEMLLDMVQQRSQRRRPGRVNAMSTNNTRSLNWKQLLQLVMIECMAECFSILKWSGAWVLAERLVWIIAPHRYMLAFLGFVMLSMYGGMFALAVRYSLDPYE